MISNVPFIAASQDRQRQNSDMLAAALGEPLTKEQIEAARKPAEARKRTAHDVINEALEVLVRAEYMKEMRKITIGSIWQQNAFLGLLQPLKDDTKIGTQLRIRLPNDYAAGVLTTEEQAARDFVLDATPRVFQDYLKL